MMNHHFSIEDCPPVLDKRPDPAEIANSYQLSDSIQVEEIAEHIYTVAAAEGDYVLKMVPSDVSLEQVTYEVYLIIALSYHDLSFRIPLPIPDAQGSRLHRTQGDAVWMLSSYLEGDPIQPNDPDQAYAVGAALGELHSAFAQLPPYPRPGFDEYNAENRTLLHLRGELPGYPGDFGLHDTPEGNHRMKRFLQLATEFRNPPPPPSQTVNWHIIHGDFFGSNLLYDGEIVCGVLDFKFARPDYRVREFSDTMMRVTNDLGPLFWATSRAFVEGYREKLNLTRDEIELVPRFIVEYHVDQVLYYAGMQPKRAAEALRIQEDISAWSEIEHDRLLAMLRGVFLGE